MHVFRKSTDLAPHTLCLLPKTRSMEEEVYFNRSRLGTGPIPKCSPPRLRKAKGLTKSLPHEVTFIQFNHAVGTKAAAAGVLLPTRSRAALLKTTRLPLPPAPAAPAS